LADAGAVGVIISIIYLAAQIAIRTRKPALSDEVLTTHWSDLIKALSTIRLCALWLRALQFVGPVGWRVEAEVWRASGPSYGLPQFYLGVLDGTLDKRLWRGYERHSPIP